MSFSARNFLHQAIDFALEGNKLVSREQITRYPNTLTMPKTERSRKARFRAALALAEMTAEQWAEREGVTAGHLSAVLYGRRSETLEAKIDAFADQQIQKAKTKVA